MKTFATRKNLYSLVTAAALSMTVVAPAVAADDLGAATSTTATVEAGDLTISDPAGTVAFDTRSITGVEQHSTGTLGSFYVSDLTGTPDGWQVSIQAAQVAGATNGYAIPTSSLSLTSPTVTEDFNYSWAQPTILPASAVDIDAGPVELASAAANAGMGKYNFSTSGLDLTLPADILADTYNVTVSLTLASGPVVEG
jgi:hypothetical protein